MIKKRIIAIMTIIILFCTVIETPLTVLASEHGGGGASSGGEEKTAWEKFDEFCYKHTVKPAQVISWFMAQYGALIKNGDYAQSLTNTTTLHNYLASGDIWYKETESGQAQFGCSAEFGKWLKDQVKQYADENEPYRIMSSAPLSAIPYSSFNYQKNVYDTIKNLMSDPTYGKGMDFGANPIGYDSNSKRITSVTVSYYLNPSDISYVSTGSNYDAWKYKETWGYSWSNWSTQVYQKRTARIVLNEDDEAIQSLSEFEAIARSHKDVNNDLQYLYINYPDSMKKGTSSYSTTNFNNVNTDRYDFGSYGIKVTPVAEHYRVYTTVDDFIDYTLNRRKIYYTSDWYDKEPGAVTVDLSEMQDTLDDIESALQKLIEQIKNDTSEDDIEKLLQEILDELRNGGGGSGGGTGGGESGGGGGIEYDDSSLLSLLSGYFEEILMYLETITQLEYIQTVTDEKKDEFKNDMDEFLNESTSAFSEIGNAYSQKFPFCLPSDLSHLFGKLSGSSSTDTKVQSVYQINDIDTLHAVAKYGGGAFSGGEVSVMSDGTIPEESIQKPTLEASPLDAPHFKLPIKVASFGIEENIDVDLKDFQPISTFSRFMMSVLFVVGLLNLSIPLLHFINSVMD